MGEMVMTNMTNVYRMCVVEKGNLAPEKANLLLGTTCTGNLSPALRIKTAMILLNEHEFMHFLMYERNFELVHVRWELMQQC